MDFWTIIGLIAAVVGIPAAIVQVLAYIQERRKRREQVGKAPQTPLPPALLAIPHNLRARGEFIGREVEKARVHEALRSRAYLVSIDGIGGIGKTSLALEVAHECLRASKGESPGDGIATFEGLIWATAKDRDLTLNALLDTIALTLEYPGIAQHPAEEKRTAVCKLLREKPYLVVVDNFETITDDGIRDFLLGLPEPSKGLITTREQKLRQVWTISLRGLTRPEALALIRSEGRRLGLAALEKAEDRVLLHLYQATGGAPLAIKWAVGQIKQRGQSLDTVLAALHEARGDVFDIIFARSWSLLSSSTRQVLVVMPLFAASALRAAVEAASDVHHFALDEALGQLVEMSLVDATDELDLARRRYSIHPLTRAFATAKQQRESESHAFERLLAYYKQFVTPPQAKQVGDRYWDGLANYARSRILESEWENMERLIREALERGHDAAALDLFLPIVHLLHMWGLWDERLRLGRELCRAAHQLGDPVEAWLWIDAIGHILRKREQFSEYFQALETGKSLADQFGLEEASILADVFHTRVEVDDLECTKMRVEHILAQVGSDAVMEHGTPVRRIVAARAFGLAASLSKRQQDFVSAKEWFERQLALRRLTGDQEVPMLSNLALVNLELGDIASAEKYLEEASAGAEKKDWPWLNYVRALVAEKEGKWLESRDLGVIALEQFGRLEHKSGVQDCEELLARLPDGPDQ